MGSSIPLVYTAPSRVPARAPLPLRKKLLFAGAIAASGLVLVELAARLLVPAPLEWLEHPGRVLQFDPVRGWALRPNAQDFTVDKPVHVNAAGFRDRDFGVERRAGVPRIACVGDSYTYGWGVDLDQSYPKQLETLLSKKTPTEVLNLGVFGYNAEQDLDTLRSSAVPYKPDLILYEFYWDDLLPVRPELLRRESFEARMGASQGDRSWTRRMLRCSRALFFAVDRARALEASLSPRRTRFLECFHSIVAGEDEAIADLWESEARAICDMRDAARGAGSRFAVVLFPLEGQVLADLPACRFQRNAQRLCDAAGVPLVSMLEPLRTLAQEGGRPYLPFEQHPTPEGYRRCTEKLAAFIEEHGLLRR